MAGANPFICVRNWFGAAVLCLAQCAMAVEGGGPPELVRAAAPGWPQWRGPLRNGASDEKGLLQVWPEGGPKLLWTASGIGGGYSSPVLSEGRLYVTGDETDALVIRAFDLDGRLQWCATNGAPWKKSYPGSRSSCAFDNGRVYHMNAQGDLACLDAGTGARLWSVNVLERYGGSNITWGMSESVLVRDTRVFATPAGAKGLMVALDTASGAPVWATPALDGERASYSSPILIRQGSREWLVNCGSRHAFAVDAATGERAWKIRHLDEKNTVNVTPLLCNNLVVMSNASRDACFIFGIPWSATSAERAWTRRMLVGSGGLVCAGGRLYGADGRAEIAGWVMIDAATGAAAAAHAPGWLSASGAMVWADGRLYCLTPKGTMALLEPVAGGVKVAGSFALTAAKVQDAWAHPVVCGGRLYLRYAETLFCYDIRR